MTRNKTISKKIAQHRSLYSMNVYYQYVWSRVHFTVCVLYNKIYHKIWYVRYIHRWYSIKRLSRMHNIILFILQHVIIIYQCVFSLLLVNARPALFGPANSTNWLLDPAFSSTAFPPLCSFFAPPFSGPTFSVDSSVTKNYLHAVYTFCWAFWMDRQNRCCG